MEQPTIFCPNCQAPNPAKNLFCQNCGKPLIPTAPPPPVPPVDAGLTQRPASEPVPVMPVSFGEPQAAPPLPGPTPLYPPSQEMPPYPPATASPQGYAPQDVPPQGYPQGMPSQGYVPQGAPQGYAAPPAFYPPPAPIQPPASQLEKLGAWVDGWADLVVGEAEKASSVEEAFVEALQGHKLQQVTVDRIEVASRAGMNPYRIVRSPWGSVSFYSRASGADLALGWSFYVTRRPRWMTILILVGVAFGLSFLTSLPSVANFGYFILAWIFGTFGHLLTACVLGFIAGYILKGSIWHLFVQGPSEAELDEATALTLAIQKSVCEAVTKAGLDPAKLRRKRSFKGGEATWRI